MKIRSFSNHVGLLCVWTVSVWASQSNFCFGFQDPLQIERSTIATGSADWDWLQARTDCGSTKTPLCLTTMSRTKRVGTHSYHDVYYSTSNDHGTTWSAPKIIPSLKRAVTDEGNEIVAADLTPQWHEKTQTFLITGKTFHFAGGTKENNLLETVAYAVFDGSTQQCGPLRSVAMPDQDHQGKTIVTPNAGCHQRVDLPNGDILMPIRYQANRKKRIYTSIVARCQFDGEILRYIEHGSEHSIPTGRGLYEPSLTRFKDRYFLTLRADQGAYVAVSSDGINYSPEKPWTFDDGQPLGSYNTQQHWLTIGKRLFLVYTRRGADNDHIMRHRAPLFIAEVDPEKLHVIRSTEQVLVPENHATLGNSGACQISDDEAWVTVAEGGMGRGKRRSEKNKVILVRVKSNPEAPRSELPLPLNIRARN